MLGLVININVNYYNITIHILMVNIMKTGPKPSVKVGDKFTSNGGEKATVIEYINSREILIKFDDTGVTRFYSAAMLKRGAFMDRESHRIFTHGYLGEGPHPTFITSTKCNPAYTKWRNMLERCYSDEFHKDHPTYKGCKVIDEWHNFQNFAEWHDRQIGHNRPRWQLDKDIIKGRDHRIYSPESCCLVPLVINVMTTNSRAKRGKWPIGVSYYKHIKRFVAHSGSGSGGKVYLGTFKDPHSAFLAYKEYREGYIKRLAEEWRGRIDERCYKALMEWEIKEDD